LTKVKTSFVCQSCGTNSPKWMGKCPGCGEWNTLQEEILGDAPVTLVSKILKKDKREERPIYLDAIEEYAVQRIITSDGELNRVLGGGVVPGSLILLGGEPGIGKSTSITSIGLKNQRPQIFICFRRRKWRTN
jgi:DNA repair protein RadA/Sms